MGGARDEGVFPIGVVKRFTGLSERQIRYYDEKGLVTPQRTPGKRRLYSPSDIERLKEIKRLLGRGLTIEEVKRILEERRKEEARLERREEETDAISKFRAGTTGKKLLPPERPKPGVLRSLYPVSNRAELLKAMKEMKDKE